MSDLPAFLAQAEIEPRLDNLHARCIAECKPGGLYLEFGVCEGTTLRMLRQLIPIGTMIYGFDSFEGLPEAWNRNPPGTFKTHTRVAMHNVELIEGWFDTTVPHFADAHEGEFVSYMHVDCDLYSSTKTVLECMNPLIVPGTVILFDELFGYGGWENHEYKAFMEFVNDTGRNFEVIARHTYFRAGIKIT